MNEKYNLYQNMLEILDAAALELRLPKNDFIITLRSLERKLLVSVPVVMDAGHTKVFEGYRVQPF